MHYLIIGEADGGEYPFAYAIMGGYPVSESSDEITYLPPDDVKEISNALTAPTDDDLCSRFDTDAIAKAEIYKYNHEELKASEDDLDKAQRFFHKLREYYQDAVKNLRENCEIEPTKFVIIGISHNQPKVSNESINGQFQNRVVEIKIVQQ